MINILTLKFGKKYGPEYVNRLYKGIKRNTTVPFKFYCYTEDKKGLLNDINIIDLDPNVKSHWQKLEFHKKGFMPEGSKCLILDIDWVILKNIDDVLNTKINKESDLISIPRWWSYRYNVCPLNGGFQMFINGDTNYLWDTYSTDRKKWDNYFYNNGDVVIEGMGEQNFINKINIKPIQFLEQSWFGRFAWDKDIASSIQSKWQQRVDPYNPYFIGMEINENIKMLHFTSDNECVVNDNDISNHQWIKECWYD